MVPRSQAQYGAMSTAPQSSPAPAEFPTLPPRAPQVSARWRRYLGVLLMRLSGWRIAGNMPDLPKVLMIVAPHTSNWDFFHGFSAYLTLQLDTTWLAKHTVFFWPLGVLARRFGGMAIDRSRGGNMVRTCVAEYRRRERMCTTITPEGTRRRVGEWKLGFYYIAKEANVPIVPVALDYSKRQVVIMPPFFPAGDADIDLPKIKALFSAEMARHPENF
jgi:1-acyl-sn-glycerol-3-phosphate acyltransferase